MNSRYSKWAVILAACLELGVVYLYYASFIGTTTALACGFAVGAVLVAALMLGNPLGSFRDEDVR